MAGEIVIIAIGIYMLFGTRGWIARSQAAHQRRLDARFTRGSDAYFDELRALEAYRPIRKAWAIRSVGALLIALGATGFILEYLFK